jgi:hypothetical protein
MGLFKKKQAPWKPTGIFSWPMVQPLSSDSTSVEQSAVSALLVKIRRDAGAE